MALADPKKTERTRKPKRKEDNNLKFIHIMKDGTIRDSVEGVVIQSEEFYRVLERILERRAREERERLAAEAEASAPQPHENRKET